MYRTAAPSLGKAHAPVEKTAEDRFLVPSGDENSHPSKVTLAQPLEDKLLLPGNASEQLLLGDASVPRTVPQALCTLFSSPNLPAQLSLCHHLPLVTDGKTGPKSFKFHLEEGGGRN